MKVVYSGDNCGMPVISNETTSISVWQLANAFAGMSKPWESPTADTARHKNALLTQGTTVDFRYAAIYGRIILNTHSEALAEKITEDSDCLNVSEILYKELLDLHTERPFDIIYEQYVPWSTASVRASARLGIPCIIAVSTPNLIEQRYRFYGVNEQQILVIEHEVFSTADIIIVTTEAVKRFVINSGATSARTVLIEQRTDSKSSDQSPNPWLCDSPVDGNNSFSVSYLGTA